MSMKIWLISVTHRSVQKYYVKKRHGAIVLCVIRVIDIYTKQINKHLTCRIRFSAIVKQLRKKKSMHRDHECNPLKNHSIKN